MITGGSFATWSVTPAKVSLLSFQRNWEIGMLSSVIITYQRDGSQVREKGIPRL